MPLSFPRRDVFFIVVAAGLVGLYVTVSGGGFPLDDSWIHQVYGRNLAENGEWAFVPGEPSAASTSPLYTVLLAVGYKLGIHYILWTHGIGVVALSVTGMVGARLVDLLRSDNKIMGLVTGLALIFSWHLIWAAAAGMETSIFALFSLILIYLVWRMLELKQSAGLRQGLVFGIAAGCMTLTRPEGVLLAGLCGLTVGLMWGHEGQMARLVQWSLGAVIGFGVVITPYLLLNLSLTGGVLPNTADAKQTQHAPLLAIPFLHRFWTMLVPILAGGQILLLPGLTVFVFEKTWDVMRDIRAVRWLLPLAWLLALVAVYAAQLPAAYQHGRYIIPALPALILMGVMGTLRLLERSRRFMLGRVFSRSLVIATGIVFVYFGMVLGPTIYAKDVQVIEEEMVAQAQWIADNLPKEELLAIHDIGAVGYFAPRPILDIAGLVTEEVVPLIGDADALWDLMERRGAQYLMAFPDQVPGHDLNDLRLCYLHQSRGRAAIEAGGRKMVIYRLDWDGGCDE